MREIDLTFATSASPERCFLAAKDVNLLADFMRANTNMPINIVPDCPGGELAKGKRYELIAVRNGNFPLLEIELEREQRPQSVMLVGKQKLQKSYRFEYTITPQSGGSQVRMHFTFEPAFAAFSFILTPIIYGVQAAALGQWMEYLRTILAAEERKISNQRKAERVSAPAPVMAAAGLEKHYEPIHPDSGKGRGLALIMLAGLLGALGYYWFQ